jgi:uncharacterized membrane protein YgdD (TMEM256/DUF423 family)
MTGLSTTRRWTVWWAAVAGLALFVGILATLVFRNVFVWLAIGPIVGLAATFALSSFHHR